MSAQSQIYFIQAVSGGAIKIGRAVNVDRRLTMLQTGNPQELRILTTACEDPACEFLLHDLLTESRLKGEWFEPTEQLFSIIKTVKETGRLPSTLTERTSEDFRGKSVHCRIIKAMGGIRGAARRMARAPTTIQSWADNGIPHRRQQLVLDVCQRDGVEIDGRPVRPSDFFKMSPLRQDEAA